MSGPVRHAFRPLSYSGSASASLRLIAVAALTLAAGGCAVSGNFGSMLSGKNDEARAQAQALALDGDETTASAGAPRSGNASSVAPESDLVFARLAIVEVLGHGSKKYVSAPWENPGSGARGTVTPIASAYTRDGNICHDFLASYVRQGAEAWYQGEACRPHRGKWEVKSLRAWTRS
jgi:outer membrane surface antigen